MTSKTISLNRFTNRFNRFCYLTVFRYYLYQDLYRVQRHNFIVEGKHRKIKWDVLPSGLLDDDVSEGPAVTV